MHNSQLLMLFVFVAACFLAAASGGIFRPGAWYEGLAKPRWRPPNWLFAPAWTILYGTIAVSGWMVWQRAGFAVDLFAIYFVSLAINAAWSAFFFGLRRMDLAFVDVVLLWLSIAATIAVFHPVDARAALLLLPYLCWVSFAALLNFTIWRMNPDAGRA